MSKEKTLCAHCGKEITSEVFLLNGEYVCVDCYKRILREGSEKDEV